jgi:hypothetical protein
MHLIYFFAFLEIFIKVSGREIIMVSQVQRKLCSDCKAKFDVEWGELEEGDAISCPECNLEYTVVADKKGCLKLIESKEFEMEEEQEEESEESENDDFDSD